jgi:hypothetical protein
MKYPFPDTNKADRRILDEIGAGNASLAYIFPKKHITERLVAAGYIRQCGESYPGGIRMPNYEMPTSWHIRWCEYQAQKQNDSTDRATP